MLPSSNYYSNAQVPLIAKFLERTVYACDFYCLMFHLLIYHSNLTSAHSTLNTHFVKFFVFNNDHIANPMDSFWSLSYLISLW